ncbi:MAG: hypothetical protein MJZ93_02990 [Paludibacteraceae bacterium]|nr:hypothetical protein [Paludibacteraceae bacterium]
MLFLSALIAPAHRHHHHHKHSKAKKKVSKGIMYGVSYTFGAIMFVCVLLQLFVTLMPVSNNFNAIEVYFRNISSIVNFSVVALFLILWSYFNNGLLKSRLAIKAFRFFVVLAAAVCVIKGISSIYHVISQAGYGVFPIIYYASNVAAWSSLGVFFAFYYNKISKKMHHHVFMKRFKILSVILEFVCFFAFLAASVYTVNKFVPATVPWLFYLADALAWLMLCVFFIVYTHSKKCMMSMHKVKKRDTSLDEKMEMNAKIHKENRLA